MSSRSERAILCAEFEPFPYKIPRFAQDDRGAGMPEHRLTVANALARLPGPAGERFVELFQHGTLSVELYAPRGRDPQTPHIRDEVYVVIQGSGEFVNGDARHRFGPGDLLFVPARVPHRFEKFTDDLAVWVMFYGPEGGEVPG